MTNIPIVAYREDYGKWHIAMYANNFASLFSKLNGDPVRYMYEFGYFPVTMLAEDWFKLYREID